MMQHQGKPSVKYKPKRRTISLHSAAWARLRALVLAEEPLCRHCSARGMVTPATEVDHIDDSRADYSDNNSRDNLQALCKPCHSVKTSASMGKATSAGCDARGVPLDPNHHWNQTPKSPATKKGPIACPSQFYW